MAFAIILIILICIVFFIEKAFKQNKQENKDFTNSNVQTSAYKSKTYLFTQTELMFYKQLVKVTDKLNLVIFPKIRIADIVNIDNKSKYIEYFNKVKSKHVDFLICDKSNCKIRFCIELDDYTHNREKQIQNDNFKNTLFNEIGIKLLRIKVSNFYNVEELQKQIEEIINIQPQSIIKE
ncbi:MAG: DUF2726 domain-containing protein [Oscillospiraceae bacterium]|nr:DUF2726 domain-containing protein [Oscillospiraceae bacterium]